MRTQEINMLLCGLPRFAFRDLLHVCANKSVTNSPINSKILQKGRRPIGLSTTILHPLEGSLKSAYSRPPYTP